MKKLNENLKGLLILLIISLIMGGVFGIYLFSEAYQSFKNDYSADIIEDEKYDENVFFGEHFIDSNLSLNIISSDRFVFNYNNIDNHIVITCTPTIFKITCILFPSLILFVLFLLVYIPIIIVDIIQSANKKNEDTYILSGESISPPSKLPNNLSIYSLLLIRFNHLFTHALMKDLEIYLLSISSKQDIDKIVEEYIKNYNNYNSFNSKIDLYKKINSMIYEELYQAGYAEYTPVRNKIIEFVTKLYDVIFGYILNWKKNYSKDEVIINQEDRIAILKDFLGTILGIILIILFFIAPYIVILLLVILPFLIINPPFKLSITGKQLKQQLKEYEHKHLKYKTTDELTPQEKLYLSVFDYIPLK